MNGTYPARSFFIFFDGSTRFAHSSVIDSPGGVVLLATRTSEHPA
jgi:hypothetical protein